MNKNYKNTLKVSLLLVLILLIISPLKYTFGKEHKKTSKNIDTGYRTTNQARLAISNDEYDSLNEVEKDVINNPSKYFSTQKNTGADYYMILGFKYYCDREAVSKIRKLYLPSGYYRITDASFRYTNTEYRDFEFNFTEVIIPGDVVEVSPHCFQNCKNLEKVVFKEGVRIIEKDAFKDCSIKEVVFSDSVESISRGAFWGNKISSITIPKKAYQFGSHSFGNQDIKYFNDLNILSNKNFYNENYLGAGQFTRAFLDNRALKKNTKDKSFFSNVTYFTNQNDKSKLNYLEIDNSLVDVNYKKVLDLDNIDTLKKVVLYDINPKLDESIFTHNVDIVGFTSKNKNIKPFGSSKASSDKNLIIKNEEKDNNKVELKVTYVLDEKSKQIGSYDRLAKRPIDVKASLSGLEDLELNDIIVKTALNTKLDYEMKDDNTLTINLPKDIVFNDDNIITLTINANVNTNDDIDEVIITPSLIIKKDNYEEVLDGKKAHIKIEEPEKPVDPEDPDKPVDPEDPDKPVEPEDPDKPVNPEDPDKPVDPEDPDKPINPDRPINPDDGGNTPDYIPEIVSPDKDKDSSKDKEENIEVSVLDKDRHFKYVQGYDDGTIRPEENITREEVAAIIFRLLDSDFREEYRSYTHNYPDFEQDRWSSKHISTLTNSGILKGYLDGEFKCYQCITRAEVATIAAKLDSDSFSDAEINKNKNIEEFKDIKGHWAEEYILDAQSINWVQGYGDGTFRPDEQITRAEFITLMNNVLERNVKPENILEDVNEFKDLDEDKWYYADIVEATNCHLCKDERNKDGSEVWLELKQYNVEM